MHVDLFQDHLALGIEVRLADQRVLEHVGQMIDRHLQVTVEHPRVVARVLLGRERVDVTAHRVEVLGDVERGPVLGALEEQVFQEMAGPADLRGFVA